MKKNIIGIIIIVSMFSATSASSLHERPEWGKYFSDRHVVDTTRAASASSLHERLEWEKYFSDRHTVGTIYIVDERPEGGKFVYNRGRAVRRFTPASTFKIPHALFALDAGIVEDEFQVFPWDGIERSVGVERYDAVWNSSQTLPSSMRYSVVWLYQQFAIEHQRLVKDIMITEAGSDYKIRSKTGWGTPENSDGVGWYVGWVERDDGVIFVAANIDMPNRQEDLPKRTSIVKEILQSIDALD